MASVTQLGYVGLNVSDIERWEQFATNILGFQSNGVAPCSGSRSSTATPFAMCRSMAARSPACAAAQMSSALPAGDAPPGLCVADEIATPEIQFVAGTRVNIPSSKGRNTL